MIVPYTELPGDAGPWPRPLLDVAVADMDEVLVPCLVDSGSLHTLLPAWLTDAAGISPSGLDRRTLAVAGGTTDAAFTAVWLTAAGTSWEAQVAFCHPWPYVCGGFSASSRSSATSPSLSAPPTSSSSWSRSGRERRKERTKRTSRFHRAAALSPRTMPSTR